MAPKLGDFVLVNETNPVTDIDSQSLGLVIHVFDETDSSGDVAWWNAVKDRGLVSVAVFQRNGGVYTMDVPASETYTDDDGRERKRAGTYDPIENLDTATTGIVEQPPAAQNPQGAIASAPPGDLATAPNTQAGDQTIASISGAQTSTEPDSSAPPTVTDPNGATWRFDATTQAWVKA